MPRPPLPRSSSPRPPPPQHNPPPFDYKTYSCLAELYSKKGLIPIPGLLETVGYKNIPVDSDSFLSGVIRNASYEPNKHVNNVSLGSLQNTIRDSGSGTHIICGHLNNMKAYMKNILIPHDRKGGDNILKYNGWYDNTALIMEYTGNHKYTITFVVPKYGFYTSVDSRVLMRPRSNVEEVDQSLKFNYVMRSLNNIFCVHQRFINMNQIVNIEEPFSKEIEKYFKGSQDHKGKKVCIMCHGSTIDKEHGLNLDVPDHLTLKRDAALGSDSVHRTMAQGLFLVNSGIITKQDLDNISYYASPLLRSIQTLHYLHEGIHIAEGIVNGNTLEEKGKNANFAYLNMYDNDYLSSLLSYYLRRIESYFTKLGIRIMGTESPDFKLNSTFGYISFDFVRKGDNEPILKNYLNAEYSLQYADI